MEWIGIGLIGLVVGALLGWLLAGRATGALRSELATHKERAQQFGGQAELHRSMLGAVTGERDQHLRDLSAHRENAAAREAALSAQIEALTAAKVQLGREFAEVGQKLLGEARDEFLKRADERFKQSEETTKLSVGALIQPVKETLARYEENVGKVEAERRGAFGELSGQIAAMRADAGRVSSEAANLVNALRNAPKARGRWGEQQLKNVLESCGLAEHTDFRTEVSVEGEGGQRLRPDAIVHVPGGKALVIDAKVSLNAYQDAFNAVDEDGRRKGLEAHAMSMRTHVNGLGNKAYWSQFDDAPDYVIMFVPGEHFLSAALESDSGLWDYAFERRVLLATPTNLVAIARTVAAVWRQEKLAKEARQIGELGKELYERLAVVGEHLGKAGSSLNSAVVSFNRATNSFNSRLVTTGKRFRDLNIETGSKSVDDLPQLESQATHLADAPALPEPNAANEEAAA